MSDQTEARRHGGTGTGLTLGLEFSQLSKPMSLLYLVQHGAAKPESEDPRRGLSDEGRRAVETIADFLSTLHLALNRIEHSEKLRARETAEILGAAGQVRQQEWPAPLATRLRPTEGIKEIAGIAPNDEVEPMLVRSASETGKLMLVGHLPYLSRLAARLLGLGADGPAVQFQMGGVVRMQRDDAGRWTVAWMLVPELLTVQFSAKP